MEQITNPISNFNNLRIEIDQLFSKVSYGGWILQAPFSKGLWQNYDLPYIGISSHDKVNRKEDILDGLLGMYSYDENHLEIEGKIELFMNPILQFSEKYSLEKSMPFIDCHINLLKIVLLHEVGHWIFHYLPSKKSHYNSCHNLFSRELQEAIAQYFVIKAIDGNEPLNDLFIWLWKQQSALYEPKLDCPIEAIRVIREEVIHNLSEQVKESLTIDWFKEFCNKRRGQIKLDKFGI